MKKPINILVAIVSVLFFVPTLSVQAQTETVLCPQVACYETTSHEHDGLCYGGHYYGDGHDDHQVCSYFECTETGVHEHDDASYFGHHNEDGHTYHNKNRAGRGHHAGRGHRSGRHH